MDAIIKPLRGNKPSDGKPQEFSGWRYLAQEGWAGAVQVRAGVIFMAALRGDPKDLSPYLASEGREATGATSNR